MSQSNSTSNKHYDFLIKGGRLLDAGNGISEIRDIAVSNAKVARVDHDIPVDAAKNVVDASGLLVCPGLIDMHSHHFFGTDPDAYLCDGAWALPPDGFTFRNGVTTVLDTGGSGWRSFPKFKKQTIDTAATRVLSLLNIVGTGMKGDAYEQDKKDMDPEKTASMAQAYPGTIVGIKLAHFLGADWQPTELTVAAGKLAGLPAMIDFGRSEPPLSLETLFMEKLRPGDIYTHCFADVSGREALVGADKKLRPLARQARKKGIWFDVGHGQASFDFNQAIPALSEGFKPDSISSDLHTGCMNAGMKDLLNVLSKFVNLGMPLTEVIQAATWNPACCLGRKDLGRLSVGSVADICLLKLREGKFGFVDARGKRMDGDLKLECELTLRAGKVVYDLNGLLAEPLENNISKEVSKQKIP